jgi:hypothetical protein
MSQYPQRRPHYDAPDFKASFSEYELYEMDCDYAARIGFDLSHVSFMDWSRGQNRAREGRNTIRRARGWPEDDGTEERESVALFQSY